MDMLAVDGPVNLCSDNVAGVAPEILAAIEAANAGTAPSYGADPITARLQDTFCQLFETRCFVQPVATGTATNGLPMALATNHVHVWKSLLERAGFTLADIPQWGAFWSFWCDQVQPAVRQL